ncbi:hypothetical protein [Achromobacter phage tuull]|nr:hypothetical protein [Achromobacter phage tuull]
MIGVTPVDDGERVAEDQLGANLAAIALSFGDRAFLRRVVRQQSSSSVSQKVAYRLLELFDETNTVAVSIRKQPFQLFRQLEVRVLSECLALEAEQGPLIEVHEGGSELVRCVALRVEGLVLLVLRFGQILLALGLDGLLALEDVTCLLPLGDHGRDFRANRIYLGDVDPRLGSIEVRWSRHS